jgi:hypothetical protein
VIAPPLRERSDRSVAIVAALGLTIASGCRERPTHDRVRSPVRALDAGASIVPRAVADAAQPRREPQTTWTLRVASAPFPAHPDVLVHAPATFDATGPIHVVVFLHGWFGCVGVVAGNEPAPCTPGGPVRYAMDVVNQFDRSHVDALLLIPQLAFDAASSAPGRLGETGGLRDLLRDVLAAPELASRLAGRTSLDRVGNIVLVGHSGAYVPLALALEHGRIEVHEVHMLDALYRDRLELDDWVRRHAREFSTTLAAPRRLTFVYTDREGTGPLTRSVLQRLAALLPAGDRARSVTEHAVLELPTPEIYDVPMFALRTPVAHEDVPRVFLAPLLAASRSLAAPR